MLTDLLRYTADAAVPPSVNYSFIILILFIVVIPAIVLIIVFAVRHNKSKPPVNPPYYPPPMQNQQTPGSINTPYLNNNEPHDPDQPIK